MDEKDIIEIHLEHYKLMRDEILQNSAEGIKAIELGISIVSILFALASSTVIPNDGRWFVFLFTPIIVSPLIMLMAQRFRQTRKIGTYIGLRIEHKLGIAWESTQQKSVQQEIQVTKKNRRITPRSLKAMSMPLLALQCLSMAISLWYLLIYANSPLSWMIWTATTVFVGYLLTMEYRVIQEALQKDFSQDV